MSRNGFLNFICRYYICILLKGYIQAFAFMGELIGLMKYMATPDNELANITYWQLGSLAKVSSKKYAERIIRGENPAQEK